MVLMDVSNTEPTPSPEAAGNPRPSSGSDKSRVEIMAEKHFLLSLLREIRRTERSGRPFVLALITSEAFRSGDGERMASRLAAAIQGAIRETDWLGWYAHNHTLGVLLTEIGEVSQLKVARLSQKLSRTMQEAVSTEDLQSLKMTIRFLPEHAGSRDSEEPAHPWYCEVQPKFGPEHLEIVTRRAFDIAGAAFALLLFLPVLLAVAALVKLTSPGPAIYRQKRVGLHGRLFDFYKFRSMYTNCDPTLHREYVSRLIDGAKQVQQSNGMYKLESDPRVTPVGRLLRKSSLDELPQFFNVLRGDMSLVGPRPPLPYEFERYRMWHRRRVLEIKPGITGPWQVNGRSRTTFDQMVRMDLHYARTRSLWTDIKLIVQTPRAMFSGTGAS